MVTGTRMLVCSSLLKKLEERGTNKLEVVQTKRMCINGTFKLVFKELIFIHKNA